MRWHDDVFVAAVPDNEWADAEKDGGQQVCEPESDELLSVNHANLANESANVNEEVEIMVNSALSDCWIVDDALAGGQLFHDHLLERDLLGDQGRDVGLERACADAHNDQTDQESGERVVWVSDDRWDGRDHKDDMTGDSNSQGNANGLVAAKIFICDIGTEKGDKIHPELIKGSDTSGGTLMHIERSRLSIGSASASLRAKW